MKNKLNIFSVRYGWYEDNYETLLVPPVIMNEEEFDMLCNSLLDQAALNAISNAQNWVGFRDIIDELVHLLKERGFEVISPYKFELWGSNIIDDNREFGNYDNFSDETKNKIIEHNKEIEEGTIENWDGDIL